MPKYLDGSEGMIKIWLSVGGGRNRERTICQVPWRGGSVNMDHEAMHRQIEKLLKKSSCQRLHYVDWGCGCFSESDGY